MTEFIPHREPADERAFLIYYARVLLQEAAAARQYRQFSASCFNWAQKARRQAASINLTPPQGDLFGDQK